MQVGEWVSISRKERLFQLKQLKKYGITMVCLDNNDYFQGIRITLFIKTQYRKTKAEIGNENYNLINPNDLQLDAKMFCNTFMTMTKH